MVKIANCHCLHKYAQSLPAFGMAVQRRRKNSKSLSSNHKKEAEEKGETQPNRQLEYWQLVGSEHERDQNVTALQVQRFLSL